ncbi:MAG TPA: ATP-binding cassette domain-containing protein [Thermoanaerobacterales bacterium]|nr:ATP-binding cassette domain-containing protein [Thermoanaerobacterales bacterium]
MSLLQLSNINMIFNYGTVNETQVFDDFNLNIEKGEFVSVVGSNGSGKTTLLNLIAGNMIPTNGSVTFEGKDILNLEEYERSQFIGRVFQDPGKGTSPSMTILENMALADNKGQGFGLKRGVNKKRLEYYRSRLEELDLGLEDKLDSLVGTLSGGQRQALALLICTLTPIKLLILDEHTAALDPKISETIMELTDKIVKEKGVTALMVTHNLRYAVEYGDRLLMMNKGEAIIDTKGEEKEKLVVQDLVQLFSEISIELGN